GNIAQHVRGVGNQRERVREDPADQLHHHERRRDREYDREAAPPQLTQVVAVVVAVVVCVAVLVTVAVLVYVRAHHCGGVNGASRAITQTNVLSISIARGVSRRMAPVSSRANRTIGSRAGTGGIVSTVSGSI